MKIKDQILLDSFSDFLANYKQHYKNTTKTDLTQVLKVHVWAYVGAWMFDATQEDSHPSFLRGRRRFTKYVGNYTELFGIYNDSHIESLVKSVLKKNGVNIVNWLEFPVVVDKAVLEARLQQSET